MTSTKNQTIMNIKLVNYKTHRGHDGMRGFNADIVYNGKKIATVHDDAYGGEFEYHVIGGLERVNGELEFTTDRQENQKLFDQLLDEVKTLPKVKTDWGELDPYLDGVISDLTLELDRKKDEKKGVLVKNNYGYDIIGYKETIPTVIKKYRDGLKAIQDVYDDAKAKGEEILNKTYLQTMGVKL